MKIIDYKHQDYLTTWQAMQNFTDNRTTNTSDEIWLVEHPPVFTLGQAGKAEHILDAGDIPVVNTDRGGQVTYHAPGQIIAYVLMDLRRTPYTIRQLVDCLEEAIVRMLNDYSIFARRRSDAPGVYVGSDKICSLGLRVRKGCSYHGLALNVDMDLAPFKRINPCGYDDLVMTQMATYLPSVNYAEIKRDLARYLHEQLLPVPA